MSSSSGLLIDAGGDVVYTTVSAEVAARPTFAEALGCLKELRQDLLVPH
jgi:hypothetical protein